MPLLELDYNPPPGRRLPDNWLILYPLQLARLAWCFHNLTAFQGCLDSTDGIFLLHCATANRLLPPMATAYGGASADVGLVTRAEQPQNTSNKEGNLPSLGSTA